MKLMLLIEMFVAALLAVPVTALTTGSGRGNPGPDFADAFRSDTTLRFMGKLHSHQAQVHQDTHESQAEATRTKLCEQHGFKVAERAGCVAYMRQACHHGKAHGVLLGTQRDSCTHFFQEEQPGYKDLQKGPNYDSKKAQKAAAKAQDKSGDDQSDDGYVSVPAVPSVPSVPSVSESLKGWQKGPQYNSEKSQKAADKVADENKKADPRDGGLVDSLKPFGKVFNKGGKVLSDGFEDAGKGPNYDKKASKKEKQEEPEEPEEPEEKEVASEPGCRNSPKGWADTKDRDCEDYAEGEWCTRNGGYGDAWLDDWGKFEDFTNKGKSAKEACCVCGGGLRKEDENEEKPSPKSVKKAAEKPAKGKTPPPVKAPVLGTKSQGALQEQGYSGELVEHEDQVTMTEDWLKEFGPHAGHRDLKTICAEHPGNEWCSLHGYYDKEPKSAASVRSLAAVLAALLLFCLR